MKAIKYGALRGRIVEKYGSLTSFANAIGKDRRVVSAKLTGTTSITTRDIASWMTLLDISVDDVGRYFFAQQIKES